MNELLERAGAIFLAPAPTSRPGAPAATGPPPGLVGVLAAPRDLCVVGGGVAADLRRRHRARAAVVCGLAPVAAARPAARSARALAERLAGHDLAAAAAGPLCRVTLPDDPEAAVRAAWRVAAAGSGCPVVVALALRSEAHDALLADADALLLAVPAGADRAYTTLALDSLARLGPPATLVRPPTGFLARRRAALGLARLAPEPREVAA